MKACRGHRQCHWAPTEEDHIITYGGTTPYVEHIVTFVDRQAHPCMSRHRLAGYHPRGYNNTGEGGSSLVGDRSWLNQVLALSATSPTIAASPTAKEREKRLSSTS